MRLQPLVYMDDTARASHSIESIRAGNIKLACLMVEKQLEIHPTKSGYLLFGSEAFKAACRTQTSNQWSFVHTLDKKLIGLIVRILNLFTRV